MEQQPIAITGMHRSGTSMVTRGLHDAGLRLLGTAAESFIDAADDNPEGFWENAAIVACNEDLLEATGGAWDNPPALPPQGADDPRVAHLVDASNAALAGLRGHRHWGFKDPRTCLTAAYWMDLEPELRFVVCVRHPLEVALSLKRRNQNSYSLALALWERYYATVLELVPADRRIVSHYDSFFIDPMGEVRRLCDFAGLESIEPQVRADLRHHTVNMSLGDANVSPSLRELYAELCYEAGHVLAPEPPPDEGRVRRLVLDGAVAERHAAQRKQAIDRLEERIQERDDLLREREQKLRRDNAAAEAHLRSRVRELEVELADTVRGITEIDRVTRQTAARVEVVVDTVTLVRVRRVLRRWGSRAVKGARSRAVQPGRNIAQRGKKAALPRARAVARKLPAPAQGALRRGRAAARGHRKLGTPPTPKRSFRRVQRTPDRVPTKEWKTHYEQLVAATVPDGEPWLVIAPGSPGWARRARSRTGAPFPDVRATQVSGVDLAYVAQLEALRFQSYRRLVVPASARRWLLEHAAIREHVTGHYRAIGDDQGGVVFDLSRRAEPGTRSLRAEITELVAGFANAPAVLDWSDLDIGRELNGVTTFVPPAGDVLPYVDTSIEIVVVNESRDHREATRVASASVITVEGSRSGPVTVRAVESRTDGRIAPARSSRPLVWSADPRHDDTWRTFLADIVADAGADLRLADINSDGVEDFEGYDVVVVVEPYVVPLPGTIEAAAACVAAEPSAVVAGKILGRDGRIEAAGGTIFADRSVGLVAHGSDDVSGAWHEYVRPVCWAPGLVAASPALWHAVPPPTYAGGRAFVREWCSEVWASGHRVLYEPNLTAVRVTRDGGEASIPLETSAWQRVLDLRPSRPRELADGEWRYLLAHDDVEACRG